MSDLYPEDFADLPGPVELLTSELEGARAAVARLEGWAARLAEPGDALAAAFGGRLAAAAELVESYRRPLAQLVGTLTASVEVVGRRLDPADLPGELEATLTEALHGLAEDTEAALGVVAMLDAVAADAEATDSPAEDFTPAGRVEALLAAKAAPSRALEVARRAHLHALRLSPAGHGLPLTTRRPAGRRRCHCHRPRSTLTTTTDDPAPRRRQGAVVGTPTSPGGHQTESERAPT